MRSSTIHPYTQAVFDAWRSISSGQKARESAPVNDYPGLIESIFTIRRVAPNDFSFRRVGNGVDHLFGRHLADHNFLTLWSDQDRVLVSAAVDTAAQTGGPVLIKARGETLDGQFCEVEIGVAPLRKPKSARHKFLGICQITSDDARSRQRPLRHLRALAVYPPLPPPPKAMVRLVTSS